MMRTTFGCTYIAHIHNGYDFWPVTVYKILVYSSEIIKRCNLPIGQISEESQEACNKDV